MPIRILTVTLNPAIDRIVRKGVVTSFAGGKGVNVARVARECGVCVKAVGVSGGETGVLFRKILHKEKIPHSFFVIAGRMRVNTTVMEKGGCVRRRVEPGPCLSRQERRKFAAFLKKEIKGCGVVVFSGSLPPGFPVTEFTGLVRMARREGAITAVDTSGTALRAAARLGVDIVKPNREEAEALLGFKLSSKPAITKALHTLHGYGIKKVLISLGSKGLAAFDGKYEVLAKVPVVRNGMPVGCGDAALAGFIVALIDGKDLKTCADRAAACGAENMKTFLRRK